MTSSFRLLVAAIIAVAALMMGLIPSAQESEGLTTRSISLTEVASPASSDVIDQYVSRTFESGLFPEATLYEAAADLTTDLTVEQVEAAFEDPDVVAFVKFSETWTVLLRLEDADPLRLDVGDILSGDWQIDEITATSLAISRGDETRLLEAFPGPSDR